MYVRSISKSLVLEITKGVLGTKLTLAEPGLSNPRWWTSDKDPVGTLYHSFYLFKKCILGVFIEFGALIALAIIRPWVEQVFLSGLRGFLEVSASTEHLSSAQPIPCIQWTPTSWDKRVIATPRISKFN